MASFLLVAQCRVTIDLMIDRTLDIMGAFLMNKLEKFVCLVHRVMEIILSAIFHTEIFRTEIF